MDNNLNILKKENSNVNFPKGEESTRVSYAIPVGIARRDLD